MDSQQKRFMVEQALKSDLIGTYLVPDRAYHQELPDDLRDWYAYVQGGGHSIVCILKQHFVPSLMRGDALNLMVPVPVKSVLRVGYAVLDDYIVVDLPYSSEVGLQVPLEDSEF